MKHRAFNLAKYRHALVVLTLIILVTGCTPAAYREPITRYQQASTVVIEGARITYSGANRGERNAEIDRRLERRERITLGVLNSEELLLLGPDDIAARMKALDALAKHGELLLTLASSDAPQRAKDAANSLDDAIVSLGTALGDAPSDRFKETAGGFATIAGEIANFALEAKIKAALDKAIVASDGQVKALMRILRAEMDALYQRRRVILSSERLAAVDVYNELIEQPNPNPASLAKAVARIKAAEDAWDDLPLLLGAGPGLDAMTQAHQKLVDYASSDKAPQDFASLVEAVDAFVTRAKVIAGAIQTIRESQE